MPDLQTELPGRRNCGKMATVFAFFVDGGGLLHTIVIILLGLAVGVLVGLMGIGGGIVLVPAFVYLLGMDQHLAQGTSLVILLPPLALGALMLYWKNYQVDLQAGIACALGFLAGGYFGGLLAISLPSRDLKGFFGLFLVFSAAMLWRKTEARGSSGNANA